MKIFLYLIVAIAAICLINFWYQFYILGKYYTSAGLFMATIFGILPILVLLASVYLIKTIKNAQ
ncbi:hypothetical protein C7T94_05360 [Pedobacter yulinensis]|uniref:Uncharacterized protein n=1 Tax=Pedobacter yulinensis TaxID=2126353 RepID=A0A2T3HNX2_9SPHI|nr:hypothetical protein [Pedobacter yulinensis]PST84158.1 hypothetical protein C7T94_05360 [Pedobacter yulinensis]